MYIYSCFPVITRASNLDLHCSVQACSVCVCHTGTGHTTWSGLLCVARVFSAVDLNKPVPLMFILSPQTCLFNKKVTNMARSVSFCLMVWKASKEKQNPARKTYKFLFVLNPTAKPRSHFILLLISPLPPPFAETLRPGLHVVD